MGALTRHKRRAKLLAEPIVRKMAVGYVRVSTEEQTHGTSLESQEERIRAYALATGRELHTIYKDEGKSACTLDRPAAQELLASVRSGDIGTVVVLKLDRLTRSVSDFTGLVDLFAQHDASLVSVSEGLDLGSACGRMLGTMLALLGQWERDNTAERIRLNLAHRRHSGIAYGRTPFGYKRDGKKLIPDPAEQAAIALMRRLDDEGLSYENIALGLTAAGHKPRGKRWYRGVVREIMTSHMATDGITV